MLMGNFMAFGSIIDSINTDTNIVIKKTVLDMINDLKSSLNENKLKLRKEEEIVFRLTKIVDEDIDIFKEFLQTANDVINSEDKLDEEVKKKVTELMESRKLDPTCKDILFFYFVKKN
jgi:hypothetical protein